MSDKLPSIDDFYEELPSIDEIIKEEKELPSVDEFVEKEEEEIPDTAPCSIEEEVEPQDLTEVIRLINDVRKDIPDIPEIKYYDEQLEQLTSYIEGIKESIPEIPEQKTYDVEIETVCNLIDELKEEVRTNAADIPEIKYYDEEIGRLTHRLNSLPEIRHYEGNLTSLKEDILAVKESIPQFPKWVNEVNEVPDFSWIGKTFGVIDSDFVKVNDGLDSIRGRIDQEIQEISENFDLKDFENKVEFEKVFNNLKETKENIYKELREAALKIHETKHSFKNDDRLLKKHILSKYNVLKQRVEEEVKEFNRKNDATKDLYGGYFEGLTQEIANLPKVKYYDEDIEKLSGDVKNLKSLYLIVDELKEKQQAFKKEFNEIKDLQEGLLNEPNDEPQSVDGNSDPLTPLDKQFPNLKSLADHYRLFISRTQQQIAVMGGGGAVNIKDLDDVDTSVATDLSVGELLIYNGSKWVGIGSTLISSADQSLDSALKVGNVSGIGMSVGVITATNGFFTGILTATELNYDNVQNIYSTGIVTATKGIQQTGSEGLHVTAGVSTFVGLTSCLGGLNVKAGSANTSLIVEGNARVLGVLTVGSGSVTIDTDTVHVGAGITLHRSTGNMTVSGIITAGVYHGDGSGLIGVASTDNISSGTTANLYGGLKVGSAATIATNGNATYSGIVTAANFVGGGANITALSGSNIASGTVAAARVATLNQDTTGNAATATILETTRAIGGVNFNGSAAINLPGVNESGNQNTSGTAAGLSGSPTITVAKVNVGTAATIHSTGGITAGIVTATSFVGPLTGNVTGNASGSSGSCTGNAATATILATARNIGGVSFDGSAAINLPGVNTAGDQDTTGTATNATNVTAADESSDTTCFPLFVTAATGNLPPKTGSNLSFNSSSGALTATSFSGDGSNLTGTGPQEADTSVSSTSATTVLSVAHASYRGSFVKVLITQGSAYQMGNYTIIHDGTTASIIEESAIATGSMLGTFSATISGINLLMQVTMGSSSSATVTVKADNITV
ncbi:hypothetical protein [uncultured Mediterranean phage]|nr:hypothetical protein [uncultured Mediterranean phage]